MAGNRYNITVRRFREDSRLRCFSAHSGLEHTAGSSSSGIGVQHTEQCLWSGVEKLRFALSRLLASRPRLAASRASPAVL